MIPRRCTAVASRLRRTRERVPEWSSWVGRRRAWRNAWQQAGGRGEWRVRLPGVPPQRVRVGGSDPFALREVFRDEAYRLPDDVPPLPPAAFIVDAGANVGYAAVWLAARHPDASVVAVEPESSNHALLLANTRDMPRIHPVRAALWHERTAVRLEDPNLGAWAFRTHAGDGPAGGRRVPTVTLPGLMEAFGRERIDLLKLDVEGAERELLANDPGPWLDRTDRIVMETHDRFHPGCSEALAQAVRGRGFARRDDGDMVVLWRTG